MFPLGSGNYGASQSFAEHWSLCCCILWSEAVVQLGMPQPWTPFSLV